MDRRAVLVGAVGTLSALAGCVSESPSRGADTTTAERSTASPSRATPNATEPPATATARTTTTEHEETTHATAIESPARDTTQPTGRDTVQTTAGRPSSPTPAAPAATDDGRATSETAARTTVECYRGVTIETESFDAAEHATAPLDDDARDIVAEAVANGTATRSIYGERPLVDGLFVEHEGAFYEVSHAVETTEVSAYRLDVAFERGQNAPADATVIAFSDLPENDRVALRHAVYGGEEGFVGEATSEDRDLPKNSREVHDYPAPYPDGGGGSHLIGNGVTWVSWDGHAFRVELGEATTAERDTHEYTVEDVAENTTEFHDVITSRYLLRLADLPEDEHRIVKGATRERYRACGTVAETIPTLDERLSDAKQLPGGYHSWYVQFEGESYLLRVLRWEA